jgi:hypothetical protein
MLAAGSRKVRFDKNLYILSVAGLNPRVVVSPLGVRRNFMDISSFISSLLSTGSSTGSTISDIPILQLLSSGSAS